MTFVKTDSVRVFEQAKAAGTLSGIALDVFGIICKAPGLTGGEIFAQYSHSKPLAAADRSRNEIAKRISDLANWGAVKVSGSTICPESGRKASCWVPTGSAPVAKSDRRRATGAPVTFSGTQSGKATENLAGAVQGLGRLLGMNVSDAATQELLNRLRPEGRGFITFSEAQAKIAEAKASENDALASRNGALADRDEAYVALDRANEEITKLRSLLKILEQPKLSASTVRHIRDLASRTSLVLKFKRFLPKRYVKQAEITLASFQEILETV